MTSASITGAENRSGSAAGAVIAQGAGSFVIVRSVRTSRPAVGAAPRNAGGLAARPEDEADSRLFDSPLHRLGCRDDGLAPSSFEILDGR
jgi:hypothetical protein